MIRSSGGSAQIDHVVISVFGIFVIETKNCKGWIYGGRNSDYWTQNIYGKKYKLYNPLLQNAGHIRAIRRVLKDYGKLPFFSIVAFAGRATLKVDRSLPVMYWRQVGPFIKKHQTPLLSQHVVEEIYRTLLSVNIKDRGIRKQHVRTVRQTVRRRDSAVSSGICPKCGGTLVLRSGKYGRFYGCSNYPRCRYTLSEE